MRDYKIGFFGVKSWEKEIIEREIAGLDMFGIGIFEDEVGDSLGMAARYEVISCFIYSMLDKQVLAKLPILKMIATRSTGVDHIDVEECKKRKIEVKNVPEYGSKTVAEYTLALMLAVAKRLVPAHQSVEEGEFSPEELTGVDLFGKTLGVVGVGKIGSNVVAMAKILGMKVIAVERTRDEALAKKLGFRYVDLETLLREADVISLHVPATKETYHLINKNNIKMVKPGTILINTSRGAIVETEALLWALNRKILRGVGLDVVEEEDKVENISMLMKDEIKKDDFKDILSFHLLRDRDDVVITPHNAFNTVEAIERIVKTTVENIREFCNS